jgi:hypothetical protein
MPNSIDISAYEKASFLEDLNEDAPLASSSTSDDGLDTTPMLKKKKANLRTKTTRLVRSPWLYLLDLCLIGVIAIILTRKSSSEPVQLQGDVTGLVPHFDRQVTTFRSHPEFISNHTSLESLRQAQEAWVNFLPRMLADYSSDRCITYIV